jgi:preprotein translocase subunit SecD
MQRVALNLASTVPGWMRAIGANAMPLGLDLRGGVHFLMQVDMKSALTKKAEALTGDMRTLLRDKNLRHAGVSREGQTLRVRFRDAATRDKASQAIAELLPVLTLDRRDDGQDLLIVATLKPEALKSEHNTATAAMGKSRATSTSGNPRTDAGIGRFDHSSAAMSGWPGS